MTPRRETLFSVLPPSNSLVSDTGGLFELTRLPSRALDSPRALLPELQRYKDIIKCVALGARVPRTQSRTIDANLDCAFVENALVFVFPNIGPYTNCLLFVCFRVSKVPVPA